MGNLEIFCLNIKRKKKAFNSDCDSNLKTIEFGDNSLDCVVLFFANFEMIYY